MLIANMVAALFFLVGLAMIAGSWSSIGFIINSFKEGDPGIGFLALGCLLISSALLIAQFVQ